MVPEDRVRADAALAVVDDGALVVGAQEDEVAVELDEIVVAEPVDFAVGHGVAVADHAPEIALSRENLGHYGPESTSVALRRTSTATRPSAPIVAATPIASSAAPPPPEAAATTSTSPATAAAPAETPAR